MPAGGARKGAGRKAGGINRKNREIAEKAKALGISPLAYMLQIVADEKQPVAIRLQAATASAPFCHPRQGTVPPPAQTPVLTYDIEGKAIEVSPSAAPPASGAVVIHVNAIPKGYCENENGEIVPMVIPSAPPDLRVVEPEDEVIADDELTEDVFS